MKVFWVMGDDGDVGGDGGDGGRSWWCVFFEVYYFVMCILNNVK